MPEQSSAQDSRQPEVQPRGENNAYDLASLELALADTPFRGKLHYFPEIGSTNTYAMEQGVLGAPGGSVYLADSQIAGRGRGAHAWSSPPHSGLYVSVLLRPALAPGDTLWFSLAAGIAALSAVQMTTGLPADLRWPNDLLFGRRKVGGILTEMHAEATRVRHLVIGIGINVHQPEFPAALADMATSLAIEGRNTKRGELLVALLRALDRELAPLSQPDAGEAQRTLMARVEAASSWIRGKAVTVEQGQAGAPTWFQGVTAGLDERGFLQVQTARGMRTVLSGGVREQEGA